MRIEFRDNKVWLYNDATDRFAVDIYPEDEDNAVAMCITSGCAEPVNVSSSSTLVEQLKRPSKKPVVVQMKERGDFE